MTDTRDDLGAFCDHAPLGSLALGGGAGPLHGLTIGIKDLFDIAGLVTGAGNPDFFAAASPAKATASAVQRLIDAGGLVVGKTITDEMAFSLNGENFHYGTPRNVAAPGRIPGGSSAGSAAATAGGLVDIGLGTDTGGSVRLPASYCGIWGLRPTHGAIPIDGCVPLAVGFDTVGWFARDAATLGKAGAVLHDGRVPAAHGFTRAVIATDAFDRLAPAWRAELLPMAKAHAAAIGSVEEIVLAPEGLDIWRGAFRIVQTRQAWESNGAWITRANPRFGPGIADRMAWATTITDAEVAEAEAALAAIRARMDALLTPETVLVMPGASAPPPLCGTSGPVLEDLRARALDILCPAGITGAPQLAVPALRTDEGPIGLGFIAARGADLRLLALGLSL